MRERKGIVGREVGEMLGLKGFKRGWEGIVERGWY
jgi:hypothetical protein